MKLFKKEVTATKYYLQVGEQIIPYLLFTHLTILTICILLAYFIGLHDAIKLTEICQNFNAPINVSEFMNYSTTNIQVFPLS